MATTAIDRPEGRRLAPARRAARLALATVAGFALVCGACSGSSGGTDGASPPASATEPVEPPSSTTTTPPSCVERLPTERKVRLVPFVLVVDGTDVSDMVDHVGGIGLVGPHRPASVTAIRQAIEAAGLPPMLASDEEGGTVQRLEDVIGPLPSAARVGALPPDQARSTYDAYAAAMADLGFDMNFAPTVDLHAESIGSRSYSSDPEVVVERAGLFVDAMASAGVVPVLKHFPGLGGTATNTDEGVAQSAPLAELEQRDLVPYQRLLDDAAVGLMMSHVRVPGLTDDLPASLSPAAYRYLEEVLGFTGLVLTDSLGAGAVAAGWSIPDAAVEAVAAGADMVIFTSPGLLGEVVDALHAAVDDGRIPADRLDDAAEAVLDAQGIDPCALVGSVGGLRP